MIGDTVVYVCLFFLAMVLISSGNRWWKANKSLKAGWRAGWPGDRWVQRARRHHLEEQKYYAVHNMSIALALVVGAVIVLLM